MIYAAGFSGGKDSFAAIVEARRRGLLTDNDIVYVCDTGNEDPLTYAFIELASRKIHPIQIISGDMLFADLVRKKGFFPSRRRQFCTDYLKIQVSTRYLLKLQEEHGEVVRIDGVRREEGRADNKRGNISEIDIDDFTGLTVRHVIHDWTLPQVWEAHRGALKIDDVISLVMRDPWLSDEHKEEIALRMERVGVPCNPLYYLGVSRVGCFPCVNAGRREMRALSRFRPEKVREIHALESSVDSRAGYASMFHRNTVPERFRTQPIVTKGGEPMMVASILDVERWANGAAYRPDQLEFYLPDDIPQALVCDRRGHCE